MPHFATKVFRNILPLCLTVTTFFSCLAHAIEQPTPVKHIPMDVPPYYVTSNNPEQRPQVRVSSVIDTLLASNDPADILRVREMISVTPGRYTPLAFAVLSFRMYEVGLRDDAMFWYYVARYHFQTMQGVLDISAPVLAHFRHAMSAFILHGGDRVIEGYALCDPARRIEQLRAAFEWVAAKPYSLLYMDNIAALPGDRRENLRNTLLRLKDELDDKARLTEDKSLLDDLARERRENGDEVRYCWK